MAGRHGALSRLWRALVWPAAVLAVLGLGGWGFHRLGAGGGNGRGGPSLTGWDIAYRTLRLFTLNLDVAPGARLPWQLWVAAFAAPALVARGIARLFREQLGATVTRYAVRPRVVVFGANERGAALVASAGRPGRWFKAVVVVDPDPRALATVTASRVRKVLGDGATPASLGRAAVPRARNVVVVTGDNTRNSAVTTAVLDLEPAPTIDVYVEVEEPGVARILEQSAGNAGVATIPFSAVSLAADAVVDATEAAHRAAGRPALFAAGPGGDVPAVVLFGTGGLVDAMVLELHRRRQVQLLAGDPATPPAAPRVLLFGPDATVRRRSLATLVGTELQVLDVEAFDVDLDQLVELDIATARQLARGRPFRQVFVLTPSDLDGGGIALTLARHLGRAEEIALVTENASTPFGRRIVLQSRQSATFAPIRLFRVPDLAYTLDAVQAEGVADRLGRAYYVARQPAASTAPDWRQLSPADRERYREQAQRSVGRAGSGTVALRRSALAALRPAEIPLLGALGFDSPATLALAGLGVDFQSMPALESAARQLLHTGADAAFAAWCEVARLHTEPRLPADRTPAGPAGDVADVERLLLLRRAVRGDPAARTAVLRAAGAAPSPGREVALLLGGPGEDAPAALELLGPTFDHRPGGPEVWAAVPPGPLRDHLARLGARTDAGGAGSTRRQLLRLWRAVVAAGPAAVRVVALPHTPAEDLLLARALGATIGLVDGPGAVDLGQQLLNGGSGIVPLPVDRMTVRAFVRPGRWPAALEPLREVLAEDLHLRYVARQRARKPAGDPALLAWSALSPWLRESNLAVVDDIPNKLATLGRELGGTHPAPGVPDPALTAAVADRVELLAEAEHGRFTAERLLSGWTGGVRDPARFASPHLQSWAELDDDAKEWDREVVRDVPAVLAAHGLGVRLLPG